LGCVWSPVQIRPPRPIFSFVRINGLKPSRSKRPQRARLRMWGDSPSKSAVSTCHGRCSVQAFFSCCFFAIYGILDAWRGSSGGWGVLVMTCENFRRKSGAYGLRAFPCIKRRKASRRQAVARVRRRRRHRDDRRSRREHLPGSLHRQI